MDPDDQMVEPDGTMFASGGLVTGAISELPAASHTWCVTVPAVAVILDWASPTNAFGEAMAFRIQAAVPFVCNGEAYIIQGDPAQLIQVDQTVDPFSFTPIGGPAGFRINNIGFRRTDGLIYGFAPDSPRQVVTIDATGAVTDLGLPSGLPNALLRGATSPPTAARCT